MKVQFQRPEIIDISPEGEGWRFVVQKFQKRQHDVKYKVADECPIPDPDDINDALENALYLESAVNGMKLGVRVKCGLQVSREGSLQQVQGRRSSPINCCSGNDQRSPIWKSLQTPVAKKMILSATLT